jgi:Binding-protein-dependent transport system inner membrane component
MPTMTLDAIRNTLFWAFSDTALWWEQQAIEDPADKRNTNAASLLHKLSSSAFDVEDATLIAHLELREGDDDEYEFYELLNTVGFEWFPQTGQRFHMRLRFAYDFIDVHHVVTRVRFATARLIILLSTTPSAKPVCVQRVGYSRSYFFRAARAVSRLFIWSALSLGSSRLSLFLHVILPACYPRIFTTFRIAVSVGLITTFTAEMVAGGGGMGGTLIYSQRFFESPTVFAYIVVMLAVGLVFDAAMRSFQHRFLRWAEEY